jgi:MFS family permease
MPALRRHAPLVGLAIVLAFAALLVWRFEWWPAVPIAILSTGVVLATRWPVDQRRLRLGALAIGASLVVTLAGFFLFLLSQFSPAAACDDCSDTNRWMLVPGLLILVVGLVGFAISGAMVVRSDDTPNHPTASSR